jgi:tetratricopeptide (TPR) repeat protein
VKKSQWITIIVAVISVAIIYKFGRTVPIKKVSQSEIKEPLTNTAGVSFDSILKLAKKQLTPEQIVRLDKIEKSLETQTGKPNTNNTLRLNTYHQLAHFWADSVGIFETFAWYNAEAARLENSEKSLTFAAHQFLENLQNDEVGQRRQWKALQAKDLFERSLKINPSNDSAKVGLGAIFLFGNISASPMEGILKIREVAEKDSTNIYAQMMLAKGSLISGQYDKAITRLLTINRLKTDNAETILMLADVYERKAEKTNAIVWYKKSLEHIKNQEFRKEILKRIEELGK